MGRYLVRRVATGVCVLAAITFAVFAIFSSIPLDAGCIVVDCTPGSTVTPAQRAEARHRLGVDRPFPVQYARFVWRLVRHASFGTSWTGLRIDRALGDALGVTASVVIGGVLLLLLLAIPLGVLSALRPHTLFDRGVLAVSIVGIALNPLIVGALLRQGLSIQTHLFPFDGYRPLRGDVVFPCQPGAYACHPIVLRGGPAQWAYHLVLPWLTFALFFLPLYTRVIRARVRETLGDPHVAVARAKGASELRVLARHVLRIALLPLTTMVGLEIGGALTASIYIEHVYALNGLGSLAFSTLQADRGAYDLPLVTAIFVTVAAAIVALNLLADLLHAWLDPRIRLGPLAAR